MGGSGNKLEQNVARESEVESVRGVFHHARLLGLGIFWKFRD